MREALDLVPEVTPLFGGDPSLGHLCRCRSLYAIAMGPRGCYGAAFGVQPGEDTLRGPSTGCSTWRGGL